MDSNFQYAGAVNLVVGPFGWVVLIGCGSERGASGTARYQRRGWAILAAGVGAARRTARSMKAASSGLSTGLPARWPQIDGIGRNSAYCQVLHHHRQQVRQRAVILAQQHAAVRPRPLPAFHDDRLQSSRRSAKRATEPANLSRSADAAIVSVSVLRFSAVADSPARRLATKRKAERSGRALNLVDCND